MMRDAQHALEASHYVFMNLRSGRFYCLPDGYEIVDRSLDDIRHVLDPRFTPSEIAAMDSRAQWRRALDGQSFLPGTVGLNNTRRWYVFPPCVRAIPIPITLPFPTDPSFAER